MKNLKKIIVAASLCAAIGATAIAGTLAYFTDTKEVTNILTVGDVSITLDEPNWKLEGSKAAQDIVAGRDILKDPTITLDAGSVESYDGMTITMPKAAHDASDLSDGDILSFAMNTSVEGGWEFVDKKETETSVTLAYVFTEKRVAGENTTPLFNKISVADSATAADFKDLGEDFSIVAKAYAVQAEGFATATEALVAGFPGIFNTVTGE